MLLFLLHRYATVSGINWLANWREADCEWASALCYQKQAAEQPNSQRWQRTVEQRALKQIKQQQHKQLFKYLEHMLGLLRYGNTLLHKFHTQNLFIGDDSSACNVKNLQLCFAQKAAAVTQSFVAFLKQTIPNTFLTKMQLNCLSKATKSNFHNK